MDETLDIKSEVDDENKEECIGQSSFDLASNNPDVSETRYTL